MNLSEQKDEQLINATISLKNPTTYPKAGGFLWNKKMLVQVNCRGYVNAQFMQPEPAKYSYGPNMEAKTFIQPEHSYFAHHPGRFFYIKDEESNKMFSVPYEPMRKKLDKFNFIQSKSDISWHIQHLNLAIHIRLILTENDTLERWSLSIINLSKQPRQISVFPYFSIGYMSWMDQSACFDEKLNAIVASSTTPYQQVDDYFKNKELKDKTFFLANKKPSSWHANQQCFEGEGGLQNPDALKPDTLTNMDARYETPVAVMQFKHSFALGETVDYEFLFGPAKDEAEIAQLSERYFGEEQEFTETSSYEDYIAQGKGCLTIESEDSEFNDHVNHWLPRQMFYHGDVNRLSTDPQTRNYIQDNMGMCYIKPAVARNAFIKALSQQQKNGAMPDGILLHDEAELKYINQVPHTDHGVWLPICLVAYLNETADKSILFEEIAFADSSITKSFIHHIELALDWLLDATDAKGLSLIEQGDWCDPMNMVGYKGKGVSSWLSLATAFAINSWCDLCEQYDIELSENRLVDYRQAAHLINVAVNEHLWDGEWFARGITDDGRVFGSKNDAQGKIFLNPQSWAMLSGAASESQKLAMIKQVNKQLMTPHGVMMLAPCYTQMVEDIGRVTQKHPGVSENGSVYNHAAIFYVYSLYQQGENNLAFEVLKKIIPSMENIETTGQLPIYIPNYYRGAFHEFPKQAGRSSHLFNTGTVSWLYRCLVEELCGLKGAVNGLHVLPKLPSSLLRLSGQRVFRESIINFEFIQSDSFNTTEIRLNNVVITGNVLDNLQAKQVYKLQVNLPKTVDNHYE